MPTIVRYSLVSLLIISIAFPAAAQEKGTPYFPPEALPTELNLTAQSGAPEETPKAPTGRVETAGLLSCFDYYKFNSTPVSIAAGLTSAIAGAPLGLYLSVKNENPYPIVDAKVYVKVMRYGHERGEKNVNAPDVVGFFPATDPFVLPAGEEINLRSIWQVPQDAEPGEYMLAAYVVSADRFEMEGLSFTDDVIGSAFNFTVVGDQTGSVSFDKDTATVAELPFRFAAYPPQIPGTVKEVPVGIDVVNTTGQTVEQEVTWTVYRWDSLRAEQEIDRKSEKVTVPAGGRVHVSYTVTDTKNSVYYVLGSTRSAGGSSSLVGIRFVRGDVNVPRLNYVGVTKYPAGEGAAAFACIHSTGTSAAENGKLELIATRPSFFGIGGTIAKQTYEGPIAGDIRALVAPFTKEASSFSVTARLFQNGVLVDQVTTHYNCADLTPDVCPKRSVPIIPLVVGGIIILLLAAAAFFIIRRRKTPTPPVPPATPTV